MSSEFLSFEVHRPLGLGLGRALQNLVSSPALKILVFRNSLKPKIFSLVKYLKSWKGPWFEPLSLCPKLSPHKIRPL